MLPFDTIPPKQNYLSGCEIEGNMTGVAFTGGATDNTVQNCRIEGNELNGVQVGGDPFEIIVDGNPVDTIVTDTKIRDSIFVGNNHGVGIRSAAADPPNTPENTTVRRSCFEDNSIPIAGTVFVTQLDNSFAPPDEGCND